jgi:hypothetical protein
MRVPDELFDVLTEICDLVDGVANSCLRDGSMRGCKCGCGGDYADWDGAVDAETYAMMRIPLLLKRALGRCPGEEAP